jgi:hypothetical protein
MKKLITNLQWLLFTVLPSITAYLTAIKVDFKETFNTINMIQHLPIIIFISVLVLSTIIYTIVQLIIEHIKLQRIQNAYIRYFHLLFNVTDLLNSGKITDRMLCDEFSRQDLKDIGFSRTDINRIIGATK